MNASTVQPPRRHEERTVLVDAIPEAVFALADDHTKFSAHMGSPSWMMLGSRMATSVDAGRGQELGSHITMAGNILGLPLALDEVVVERVVPSDKAWETVGMPRLLVVGPYRMGFQVVSHARGSAFRVFIDYELPKRNQWLGRLLGRMYSRWCVDQMATDVQRHFSSIRPVSENASGSPGGGPPHR
jgi:hypothetical protein